MTRNRGLLYPAFFLSGVCGLVYQVIWVRQLSLLLGNTTEAVATVLAAFMLGLSLGSRWIGAVADRSRHPLRLYGAIEVAIGVTALAATYLFDSLGPVYRGLARGMGAHGATFAVVRFLFAFATVTVPTALMGATLPVVTRARIARDDGRAGGGHVGGEIGRLYALNTLGAALGCCGAGFWALGHLGLHRTAALAAAGNVVVGVVVALLARAGVAEPEAAGAGAAGAEPAAPASESSRADLRRVWLAVITSGFVGLALEGIWTRVLQFSVGSTVYAFSLMLTVFLVGLAIGSYAVSRWADRIAHPVRALGLLALLQGQMVALSVATFLPLSRLAASVAANTGSFVLSASLTGLALMGLPTLVLGAIFPLGTRIGAALAARVGRDVGGLYALNTLGSIAGSLATAFVLIPLLGTESSLWALGLVSATVGTLLLADSPARRRMVAGVGIGALAVVCATGGSTKARFLAPLFAGVHGPDESPEPVFFREGRTSTVSVHRYQAFRNQGALRLYTNGSSMTGTFFDGQRYMKLLGHLPVLLAKNPERVLTICFGTGMTFGATALHPEVKQSQCAELSATVLEAAPLFAEANGDVLTRANARVRVGDGRQVLLASAQRFDVITAEPPPPRQAGTYQLYSREFYQLARERLSDDGIVAQWLPLHDQSELEVRMSVRSFVDVFPNAQLWLPHAAEGILIGSPSPIVLDTERFAARWATPEVAESLASIGFSSPATLLKTFVMDGEALGRYAAGAPAITDDRPLTDFWLDLPPFMKSGDIGALLAFQQPITALGLADVNARPVEELREGHRAYLEGVIHNVRERIYEAHVAAPDDRFYAETLSIAPWQRANLEAALAAKPGDVKLHLDLARVELNAHDFDAAVATLRKVTAGAPQLAIGWFNLGWTLEMADRLDEASEAYRKAIEVDGRIQPQIEPRLAVLEAARKLVDPKADAAELAAAATTFGAGGRADLALAALRRATDEDPGDVAARTALVKLLVDTGRHDEAEQVMAGAAEGEGGGKARTSLALQGARNDLALGRFEAALAALPASGGADDPEACWVRAQALRELGRGADARRELGCAAKSARGTADVDALEAALKLAP